VKYQARKKQFLRDKKKVRKKKKINIFFETKYLLLSGKNPECDKTATDIFSDFFKNP
jgi:hypothetical protein